jgi:hypothetical protein
MKPPGRTPPLPARTTTRRRPGPPDPPGAIRTGRRTGSGRPVGEAPGRPLPPADTKLPFPVLEPGRPGSRRWPVFRPDPHRRPAPGGRSTDPCPGPPARTASVRYPDARAVGTRRHRAVPPRPWGGCHGFDRRAPGPDRHRPTPVRLADGTVVHHRSYPAGTAPCRHTRRSVWSPASSRAVAPAPMFRRPAVRAGRIRRFRVGPGAAVWWAVPPPLVDFRVLASTPVTSWRRRVAPLGRRVSHRLAAPRSSRPGGMPCGVAAPRSSRPGGMPCGVAAPRSSPPIGMPCGLPHRAGSTVGPPAGPRARPAVRAVPPGCRVVPADLPVPSARAGRLPPSVFRRPRPGPGRSRRRPAAYHRSVRGQFPGR